MPYRIDKRIEMIDWSHIEKSLHDNGFGVLPAILDNDQCNEIITMYGKESYFRTTINMERYRFGKGEYKYFNAPLPTIIEQLRIGLYPELAKIANSWLVKMGSHGSYPLTLDEFLNHCHQHDQIRSTPLILKYEEGGYNCLHQDLYGDVFFPFQVVFVLNKREIDYEGGEFLLIEQRPRAQSKGQVITLVQGAGLIFPTNNRPTEGKKGYYKATIKHGVSTITAGTRYSLGIIFHDAK